MSVLPCCRNGCESIMCDFYSTDFGYLCNSCKIELEEKGNCSIREFMESPKPDPEGDTAPWRNYVDAVFQSRHY